RQAREVHRRKGNRHKRRHKLRVVAIEGQVPRPLGWIDRVTAIRHRVFWAEIEPLPANDNLLADQVGSVLAIDFRLDHNPGALECVRAGWGGRPAEKPSKPGEHENLPPPAKSLKGEQG